MEFKLDLGAWGGIFAVPCRVVDEHLRLAGAAQLKVLLYCLRHNDKEISDVTLSKALGISKADVCDAMQYWSQVGLINMANSEDKADISLAASTNAQMNIDNSADKQENESASHDVQPIKPEADDNTEAIHKQKKIAPITTKPSGYEVNQRAEESEEIAFLLQETQMRLSRMITHSESSTLVYLHDYVGLPTSVILMVMQYAAAHGKCNMRYIEKVALQWAEEDIYTFELAEKKIKDLEIFEDNWGSLLKTMGLDKRTASPTERKYLTKWLNEWGFSMEIIKLAYYECADNTHKVIFKYIDKVLESWYNAGIKTADDVKALKNAAGNNKKVRTKKDKTVPKKTSFDLDEYEQLTDINPEI